MTKTRATDLDDQDLDKAQGGTAEPPETADGTGQTVNQGPGRRSRVKFDKLTMKKYVDGM